MPIRPEPYLPTEAIWKFKSNFSSGPIGRKGSEAHITGIKIEYDLGFPRTMVLVTKVWKKPTWLNIRWFL